MLWLAVDWDDCRHEVTSCGHLLCYHMHYTETRILRDSRFKCVLTAGCTHPSCFVLFRSITNMLATAAGWLSLRAPSNVWLCTPSELAFILDSTDRDYCTFRDFSMWVYYLSQLPTRSCSLLAAIRSLDSPHHRTSTFFAPKKSIENAM